MVAWGALIIRFDNQILLATAHLEKFFVFEWLLDKSVPVLISFINTFFKNVAVFDRCR